MSMASRIGAAVVRSRAVAPAGVGRRMVSGGPEELKMSKDMWFKTSVASCAFILTPFTLFTIYKELTHHHAEDSPVYPHMHIMHKRWPWTSNCALFDIHCKKEWKAAH